MRLPLNDVNQILFSNSTFIMGKNQLKVVAFAPGSHWINTLAIEKLLRNQSDRDILSHFCKHQ